MAVARWEFRGPGGWQEFHTEQHENMHAAWLAGRPSYAFSLAGNDYRIDLRSLVQVNVATGTERKVRPPAWAASELKVGAYKPQAFYARAAADLLRGGEDREPVCELRLLARGAAIPAAVHAATQAEAAGVGEIRRVLTETPEGERRTPQITIDVRSLVAVTRSRQYKWDRMISRLGKETESMPKLNLIRLMKEFRRIEQQLKSGSPVAGVLRCEPVEDSLLEWDVAMAFPEDSILQRGMSDLAESAGEAPAEGCLLLRARFPLDFPANPPEVWVRRPRLVHKSAPVTFGGRLCNQLLSSIGWEPSTSMCTVLEDVQRSLVESGTEVDSTIPALRSYLPVMAPLERLRTHNFPGANSFSKEGIKVMSPETARPFLGDIERLELTDKIALPLEYLEEICGRRALESPAMFEVKSKLGRKRHCAVFDWVDGVPSGHAILPRWVLEDLAVDEWEQVQVRGVRLELASYVKVQPHSAEFYSAAHSTGREIAELLTENLRRFSALTEDTCVPIEIGGQNFSMQIVQLRPQAAVRIIDSDVEAYFEFKVDFEPAPDLEDEAAVKARQERLLEDFRAQKEKRESAAQALAERREAALQRRYDAALARAEAVAGAEHQGGEGPIQVEVKLPDGSKVQGCFAPGAPVAALAALALRSPWAEASRPWGVQLRERHPPRALQEGQAIGQDMHRSVVIVQEEVPDESDVQREMEAPAAALPPAAAAADAAAMAAVPSPEAPPPPPMPVLERNVSELQRRTLQAFEAHAFELAGVEPEEALERARRGEVFSSAEQRRGGEGSAAAAGPRRAAPRRPELHRSVSMEERREAQVDDVMNIAGVPRGEALQALQDHNWNTEAAVNAIFDAFMSGSD